jgi:hypothetical protein
MDGWLNICGDGHQLVAGGQISKHDKDQRREEENKKEKRRRRNNITQDSKKHFGIHG